MKKSLLLITLSFFLCLFSCNEHQKRAKPPVPASPSDLVTGCYYITDDTTRLKRTLEKDAKETYYIDPKPIFQVGNFKEVTITDKDGFSLNVILDEIGKAAFAKATERSVGKKLAFIINNILVMAPTVMAKIDGGELQITGNFTKKQMNGYYERISHEMYE